MPNTFLGLGKAININKFLLEIDNYYDVQKSKEDDKVTITISFLKIIRFSTELARKNKSLIWWQV